MDIVLITRDRPELTEQTIRSMIENASDWSRHRLVVVFDGNGAIDGKWLLPVVDRFRVAGGGPIGIITTGEQVGVGGAKNAGAKWVSSSFTLKDMDRGERLLMFSDNDMYYLPRWDSRLELAMKLSSDRTGKRAVTQLGGWKHPYHQHGDRLIEGSWFADLREFVAEVDAATGNCFVMRWADWLKYGPFDANAIGPGQSEDFALSQKIKAAGGLVATLDPPVAIHCGLVNSNGEPAVGWRECEEMITQQLAALPEALRNEVIVMRPAPFAGVHQVPSTGAGRTLLVEPDGRVEMEIDARPLPCKLDLDREFEIARGWLGMQPRVELDDDPAFERNYVEHNYYKGVRSVTKLGLNVGSGQRRFTSVPDVIDWCNIDVVSRPPDQVPDMILDASTDALPRGADYVVLHHVIEHFGCGEADAVIRNCWEALKPGGSLLVFVPDMRKLAGRWLSGEIDDYTFMVNTYGAYQGEKGDRHKWGFSCESLEATIRKAVGADHAACTRAVCPCNGIPEFNWRDIPGADIARDWWILGVEVVKP